MSDYPPVSHTYPCDVKVCLPPRNSRSGPLPCDRCPIRQVVAGLFVLCLVALAWPSWAAESYLPPRDGCGTWTECYRDQVYETEKWFEATQSEYEVCSPAQGSTVITRYSRPSDHQFCYYWSLYMHNRSLAWMLANGALALGTMTCEQIDVIGRYRDLHLTCEGLQEEFGPWTR